MVVLEVNVCWPPLMEWKLLHKLVEILIRLHVKSTLTTKIVCFAQSRLHLIIVKLFLGQGFVLTAQMYIKEYPLHGLVTAHHSHAIFAIIVNS